MEVWNGMIYVVLKKNERLFKGDLNACNNYLHSLKNVEKDTYYYVANCLEYEHPSNTEKFFNSYITRYNNEYYDFIKQCQDNHLPLLKYMDGLKTQKRLTLFDFI